MLNETLAQIAPPGWVNPKPASRYDLVVIGGGTAGLVAAAGAAGLGARVALVERHQLGGDCLNTGCVPSKTLISSARAGESFHAALARVRLARATLAVHDSAQRFTGLGVDVFFGSAAFDSRDALVVNGTRLRFTRAVIATGSRPVIPDVPGLEDAAPLTTDTVFALETPPRRLAIVGGGAIGCELAQAFQRLGVQVVVLHDQPRLLERQDQDASAIVDAALERDGVRVIRAARLTRIERHGDIRTLSYTSDGREDHLQADAVLVAAGRQPSTDGLALDAAEVERAAHGGPVVDDFLRTTNARIFACGDVCLPWRFTHAADAAARIVVQNALFAYGPLGRRRVSSLLVPSCIYTDPEVAQVGVVGGRPGAPLDTWVVRFETLDRAVTDGRTDGFVKIYTRAGRGTIAGATIVGPQAGDIISEVSVAMAGGLSLGALASVIHPYPTYAEAIRKCGDAYNRARLTPRVRRLLAWRLERSR